MPNVILLAVAGEDSDRPVLQAAADIARATGGHIQALHVRPDVQRDIASLASSDMGLSAGLDSMIARMEADADKREQAAEAACRDLFGKAGIPLAEAPGPAAATYEWMVETGNESDWLAECGRVADMLVVGRQRGGDPAHDLMEAALMDTGKPVLIVSATGGNVLGPVAVAWKNTREAAGAVAAATGLIERAPSVTILTVEEDPDVVDKSHQRLRRALRWHNPNVSVQVLPREGRSPVEALMEAATKAGCGLVVMGGYGHARLREAVFGGFTRAVLDDAKLAVLIAH